MTQKIKGPVFSIPADLCQAYTMNGLARIKVEWFYSDTAGETLNWTKEFYQELKDVVAQASKDHGNVYYSTDYLIPDMFAKYPITAKSVAVIGSATPLYEAYIEHFGGQPLTIEYRKIRHNIENLATYTFDHAIEKVTTGSLKSDHAFCYSSIEHSGLGRYGDYLNPEGDFVTMEIIKNMVKPGGLLFLQIPVGRDALLWNGTRIYGPFRLLLLLAGWELVDTFGYQPEFLNGPLGSGTDCIFVLRNSTSRKSLQNLFTNSQIESFQAMEGDRSIWQNKIKELSGGFIYQKSAHPRVRYTPPTKIPFVNKFKNKFQNKFKIYLKRYLS